MDPTQDQGYSDTGALEPAELLTPEDRIALLQQHRARLRDMGLSDTEIMFVITRSNSLTFIESDL